MIIDYKLIMDWDDKYLLSKIKNNNTGYRFGDIVLNYPCERETYKKLLKLQSKKFPNSCYKEVGAFPRRAYHQCTDVSSSIYKCAA